MQFFIHLKHLSIVSFIWLFCELCTKISTQLNQFKRMSMQELKNRQVRNFREKVVNHCVEFKKTVQQLEDKARRKGKSDIVNESLTLYSQIRKIVNYAEQTLNCQKEDIQTLRMIDISQQQKELQLKVECLKRKLAADGLSNEMKDMDRKIYMVGRVLKSIQNLNDIELQRYYRILYRMLINHFVAFKLMSKELSQSELKACELGDDPLVGYICLNQPGIQRVRILKQYINVPFDILNTYQSIKPSQLSETIAFKLRDQVSQQQLTQGLAQLIEKLLVNQDYNSTITKILQTNDDKYLGLLCIKIAGRRVSLEEVFGVRQTSLLNIEKLVILQQAEILQILYAAEEYQVREAFQDNKWSQLTVSFFTMFFNVEEQELRRFRRAAKEQVIPRVEQIREVDQSPNSYVISNTGGGYNSNMFGLQFLQDNLNNNTGGYKLPKRQQQPQHQLWWCWCLPTAICLSLYCSCQGCNCAKCCTDFCNAACKADNCGLCCIACCGICLRSLCHF